MASAKPSRTCWPSDAAGPDDVGVLDEFLRGRVPLVPRGDLSGAYRVLAVAAGMLGDRSLAETALQELRRTQPNLSLAWITTQLPWGNEADREHYLEGFRRAGLSW